MGGKSYGYSGNDFAERDAKLQRLKSQLNRARVQGNKHLANDLEKQMAKIG